MSHRNASCQTKPCPTVTLDQVLPRGLRFESETSVSVSATAFTTRDAFGANGIHFRLDLLHGHRLIGHGMQVRNIRPNSSRARLRRNSSVSQSKPGRVQQALRRASSTSASGKSNSSVMLMKSWWLRDIGLTHLGASLTRHRADFCPSNRVHRTAMAIPRQQSHDTARIAKPWPGFR